MFWIDGYAASPKTVAPMPTYTHGDNEGFLDLVNPSALTLTLWRPLTVTPEWWPAGQAFTATPLGWVTGCYIICSLSPPPLSAMPCLSLDEPASSQEAPCASLALSSVSDTVLHLFHFLQMFYPSIPFSMRLPSTPYINVSHLVYQPWCYIIIKGIRSIKPESLVAMTTLSQFCTQAGRSPKKNEISWIYGINDFLKCALESNNLFWS